MSVKLVAKYWKRKSSVIIVFIKKKTTTTRINECFSCTKQINLNFEKILEEKRYLVPLIFKSRLRFRQTQASMFVGSLK